MKWKTKAQTIKVTAFTRADLLFVLKLLEDQVEGESTRITKRDGLYIAYLNNWKRIEHEKPWIVGGGNSFGANGSFQGACRFH